jgi:hypothetical protein
VKQLKVKVRKAYNRRKLGKQFQASETTIQAFVGNPPPPTKKEQETYYGQYYKTKVNAGQSSTSMQNFKEKGKILLQLKSVMADL